MVPFPTWAKAHKLENNKHSVKAINRDFMHTLPLRNNPRSR
jgi:hypothetical protein